MKESELIFPKWKPRLQTIRKFQSDDFKTRYKALRNSSDAFINKEKVRRYIKDKYENRCCLCGSEENLQIDHIVSVFQFAQKKLPYVDLNKEDNLALLCVSCNAAKEP